ncbi:MAG: hypothetical protein KDK25_08900 [Leptospiraceae bacterium]|nr:hypothetical protein [Leptospiraceae bacterium]
MRRLLATIVLVAVALPGALQARDSDHLKHELGIWLGGSFPFPSTPYDEVLDSNVGGGMFYRVNWPWIFYSEFGFSYTTYFSRTTQLLVSAPVYGALVYPLPLPFRLQVMAKIGGGAAYLEVRPQNLHGWDPMIYGGLEMSLLASRRFRVGLRLDANYIMDSHRQPPLEAQIGYLYPGTTNARYMDNRTYDLRDGGFYHFGLMVSFIL